jgi:hypothetical protein
VLGNPVSHRRFVPARASPDLGKREAFSEHRLEGVAIHGEEPRRTRVTRGYGTCRLRVHSPTPV